MRAAWPQIRQTDSEETSLSPRMRTFWILGLGFVALALGVIGYLRLVSTETFTRNPLPVPVVAWPWTAPVDRDLQGPAEATPRAHEVIPLVTRALVVSNPVSHEYPEWFLFERSPDQRYEIRQFISNSSWDHWYVKDLKSGRVLDAYPGTTPAGAAWTDGTLVVDATGARPGERMRFMFDLEAFEVKRILVVD